MLSLPSLPGAISTLWVKPIHKIFFLLPEVERIPIILFDKLCLRVTISCLWKVEMSFSFYFISYLLMFLQFWDLGTGCISALSLLHHSMMREKVKSYIFLFLEPHCLCSIPWQLFCKVKFVGELEICLLVKDPREKLMFLSTGLILWFLQC